MDIITGIMISMATITVIVLVILSISFISQLYETIKENAEGLVEKEKQIYCPFCGSNKTDQITKMIIVMQLPGTAIDCACFYCRNCSKRWFMEIDTHERGGQRWCESETKWIPDVDK